MSIVGVAPHNKTTERACTRVCALLLCAGGAEEDPVAEVLEIAEAEADALEDFGLVVAALGEAVGVGIVEGVENLVRPVMYCLGAGIELFEFGRFSEIDPFAQQLNFHGRKRRAAVAVLAACFFAWVLFIVLSLANPPSVIFRERGRKAPVKRSRSHGRRPLSQGKPCAITTASNLRKWPCSPWSRALQSILIRSYTHRGSRSSKGSCHDVFMHGTTAFPVAARSGGRRSWR